MASVHSLPPDIGPALTAPVTSRYFRRRQLARGDYLFRQGETGRELYFVVTGRLAVVLEITGHNSTRLRELGPGSVIGEMAIYMESTRSASILAEEPTELWELTAEAMERMEQDDPSVAALFHRAIIQQQSARIAQTTRDIRRPLSLLNEFVRAMSGSGFAADEGPKDQIRHLAEGRNDELGQLAGSFLHMEETLQQFIRDLRETTAAKERIEREMELAASIQASFLPPPFTAPPHASSIDVAGFLRPAKQASGDLYDYRFLDRDRLLVLIGDVSDKGMPAALFMAVAIALVRSLAAENPAVGRLLSLLNDGLCRINASEQFLSAFAAVLDVRSGELRYANGGHNLPFIRRADGRCEPVEKSRGVLLGNFEGALFAEASTRLGPGDTLVLYTDGVTEAFSADGGMFGEDRLQSALAAAPLGASANDLNHLVVGAVEGFCGDHPQSDDITLLTVHRSA